MGFLNKDKKPVKYYYFWTLDELFFLKSQEISALNESP